MQKIVIAGIVALLGACTAMPAENPRLIEARSIARQLTEERVDLTCFLERGDTTLQLKDGLAVRTGKHQAQRFRVMYGRPLGPYNEWALQHTTEPFA